MHVPVPLYQAKAELFRALAHPATHPQQLNRPGHIFPLRARAGGVLERNVKPRTWPRRRFSLNWFVHESGVYWATQNAEKFG